MGLSGKRSFALQEKFVGRAGDIISSAKSFLSTHEQIIARLHEQVYSTKEYEKLPERVRAYIRGYLKARFDELYRYELEWRMWVDFQAHNGELIKKLHAIPDTTKSDADLSKGGNLLTRKQIDELHKMPEFDDIWCKINNEKSCHTWKGRPDKPFNPKADSVESSESEESTTIH